MFKKEFPVKKSSRRRESEEFTVLLHLCHLSTGTLAKQVTHQFSVQHSRMEYVPIGWPVVLLAGHSLLLVDLYS